MTKRSDNRAGDSARGFERVAQFVRASEEVSRATRGAGIVGRALKQVAPAGLTAPREQHGEAAAAAKKSGAPTRSRDQENENRATSVDAARLLNGIAAAERVANATARLRDRMRHFPALDLTRKTGRAGEPGPRAAGNMQNQKNRAPRDAGRETVAGARAAERYRTSMKALEALSSGGSTLRGIEVLGGNESANRGARRGGASSESARTGSGWGSLALGADRALEGARRLDGGSKKLSQLIARAIGAGSASTRGVEASGGSVLEMMKPGANRGARVALAQNLTVAAPARLTSPKFLDPPVSRFDREAGGGHGALTFNSSPTVVVNSADGRIDVEREIVGALRAHREELFNSLRREAARRERAQF